MTEIQKTLLAALGFLIAVCVIVGAVLRHHIGGFIETVAREAREEEARREREDEARLARETASEASHNETQEYNREQKL